MTQHVLSKLSNIVNSNPNLNGFWQQLWLDVENQAGWLQDLSGEDYDLLIQALNDRDPVGIVKLAQFLYPTYELEWINRGRPIDLDQWQNGNGNY